MKITSLQISDKKQILFNSKVEETGYFKNIYRSSIILRKNGVLDDFVGDKVNHGGIDKACYLFGYNNYKYWNDKYPDQDFYFGKFGENITLDELNEDKIHLGDEYKLGNTVFIVTQPRRPCYKMGIAFNNQLVVQEFRDYSTPGAYVKILKEGEVKIGDEMVLQNRVQNSFSLIELFKFIYSNKFDEELFVKIINHEFVANRVKEYLLKKWKNK